MDYKKKIYIGIIALGVLLMFMVIVTIINTKNDVDIEKERREALTLPEYQEIPSKDTLDNYLLKKDEDIVLID